MSNSPTRTAKYPLPVYHKVPHNMLMLYDDKGHMLRSELSKGELEFLHDVTASVTCQTCHPESHCSSASQQQQHRRHAYAHTCTQHTHKPACTHTLSNDSANSHDRRIRSQMIKSLFVEADVVDSLGCCPTPFQ